MTSIFHSGLLKDISSLLNDADDFNVIIKVGDYEYVKEFRAHSVILRARCPYFKNELSDEKSTKKNNMITFNIPNITPTVFEMVLKYIYTGELDLTNHLGENILGLLVASYELFLEELFIHVQEYLIEEQAPWVQKNFVQVLHTVFKLKDCEKIQDYCLGSICADPQPFITSKKFPSLDKDILYGLLKRDDFPVEESIIWDCLIKWGIKQTPGLGNVNGDRTKWSNSNYHALKKTLNPFIPLIRFAEFSPAEYFDKIRPYKTVIPNNIYDEIEEYYFKSVQPKTINLTPRKKIIESNLIKPKLANIIASWIERKDEKDLSVKYKFDLLYRSSRDGLNINTFRTKCNGQGRCLVLVKHPNSAKIYGGYNPLDFVNANGQNYSTTESFIFSFENSEDIQYMKISRVQGSYASYAIYEQNTQGFNFGNTLYLHSNLNIYFRNQGYYDNNINNVLDPYPSGTFVPAEIEVFKMKAS
uniref:Kelch-like protein 17 n=1 Tax=Rhizophagus irregularis (strain DAOM 181602 / DAOM 197198 / MUCL 43194) TaxID=747089 RepID=U9UI04_RHIID